MMAHIFILTATEVNKRASNVVERREVIDKCFLGLISTLQIIFGYRTGGQPFRDRVAPYAPKKIYKNTTVVQTVGVTR